jgi:uncharacterized membrane protein (UPF0127 family)
LIYLNEKQQVIYLTEHFPRFHIAPLIIEAASVLEMPTHTIYSSQTSTGDQLVICEPDEIQCRLDEYAAGEVEIDARRSYG